MYCSNCNKSFSDQFSFCDNCGGKLEKGNGTETNQIVTPQPSAPYQPENQSNPTPNPTPTYQAPAVPPTYAPQPHQTGITEQPNKKLSKTVSFGTWIGIIFLNIIPFIFSVIITLSIIISNIYMLRLKIIEPVYIALLAFALFYIILLFVWAFGKPKARSLKNYASATLLMTLLVIILMAVVYFVVRDSDVVTQFVSDFNEMFESLEMMY